MEELLREIEEIKASVEKLLPDDRKLRETFRNCFESTAVTTTKLISPTDTFVFTGDIPAMWLRDSSAQVVHYLKFIGKYEKLRSMVKGLIERQFKYIGIDPYANAFNEQPDGSCYEHDRTESNAWEWERKYEVDSLCYPIWLLYNYLQETGDYSVFTGTVWEGMIQIINTWRREQHHETHSDYYFERTCCPESDTLPREGMGTPVGYTGMTWSGFRPSDDACMYGYLIPANMFASVVLKYVCEMIDAYSGNVAAKDLCMKRREKLRVLALDAQELRSEILSGIEKFGIYEHESFGKIYAYEADGFGSINLMDDANVPSLLSLPWLGFCSAEDELYRNTRRFVLSRENPYFFEGSEASGIGSPHTPKGYIWPIALTMQALTSTDIEEKKLLVKRLLETDGGCSLMHESFDGNDAGRFTREWFAWANSLFALLVLDIWT